VAVKRLLPVGPLPIPGSCCPSMLATANHVSVSTPCCSNLDLTLLVVSKLAARRRSSRCSFFVAVSRIALLPMGCFDTLLMVRASKTSEQTGAVSRSPCSSSHWVRASDMLTHACLPLLPFQRLPWNGESRQEKIGATRKTSSVDRLE